MDVSLASSLQGKLTIFFGTRKVNRMNDEIARRERIILNCSPAATEVRRLVNDINVSLALTESLVQEFGFAESNEKYLLILRIEKEDKHFKKLKKDLSKIVSKMGKWLEDE